MINTRTLFLWFSLSMAIILGPSCVREEAPASSEEPSETEKPAVNEGTVIFYSATVSDADATRATLDSDKHYIFETGDQLVLTGTNISGTLTLKTGAGENNATFDGNLTYTGEGSPAPDLELKAYLKSTSDAMTSMSYDSAEYPTSAITATTAEAVQKYSHFTGTSTFAAKSFTVSQQSTFLNFIMTFEDATKAGDVLDIYIDSGTGTMRTGSTTATLSGSDVMALFVAVVPAGTELNNATVQVGGKALPFGGSITLAANKIYNIRKRVPAVVGLEAVSLGLSSGTRWANMNLGATDVPYYGQFFAWGETQDYGVMSGHTFSWDDYKWSKNGSSTEFFRYNSQDNIKTLMLEYDDAAWAKWGALWRMPTKDEMDELIDQTTQQVVANYESSFIAGVKFISKEDASKHIFLSFGGYMDATVTGRDHSGYYWTSTLGDDVASAQYLYMHEGGYTYTSSVARYLGISIRPVYIRKELVAVDLGLPSGTKWANMNIGAEEASQYGQMFAWGETTGYSSTDYSDHSFNWDNYIWNSSHDGPTFTKYTKEPQSPGDGKDRLEPEDDAAAAIWGDPWLMPTKADFTELIAGTTQRWVANYNGTGVSGMKFVSKAAGNSNYIFLPAVGARINNSSNGAGTEGFYWSSSLSDDGAQKGCGLWFNSSNDSSISSYQTIRSCGLSIRPVIRMMQAPALNLTSPAVGQVIGNDGKNYAANATLPTGVTKVAMIAYVSGSNGLAIALADEGSMKWAPAVTTAAAHTPVFSNGTWKLPTQAEWNQMFSANGGNIDSYTGLNTNINTAGGTTLQETIYWSSSEKNSGVDAYGVQLYNGDARWWSVDENSNQRVRACLAF